MKLKNKKLITFMFIFIIISYLCFIFVLPKTHKDSGTLGKVVCDKDDSFQYVKGATKETDINSADLSKLNWVEIPFTENLNYNFSDLNEVEKMTAKCNPIWYADK